jgi:hypothetical protein
MSHPNLNTLLHILVIVTSKSRPTVAPARELLDKLLSEPLILARNDLVERSLLYFLC